jgi:hypothetical protein
VQGIEAAISADAGKVKKRHAGQMPCLQKGNSLEGQSFQAVLF